MIKLIVIHLLICKLLERCEWARTEIFATESRGWVRRMNCVVFCRQTAYVGAIIMIALVDQSRFICGLMNNHVSSAV